MTTQTLQVRDLIKGMIKISDLPPHIASSIRSFQQDNYSATQGDVISAYDALDYWLTWQGIIRYTDNVINLFVSILEASRSIAVAKNTFRVNEAVSIPIGEDFYVTYSIGSQLHGCYSRIRAADYLVARRVIEAATNLQFAFMYDATEFAGQAEKYGLKEVPLQPQGKVE